jgi:hypothetical protein
MRERSTGTLCSAELELPSGRILTPRRVAGEFAAAVASARAREIVAWGSRGDRKTSAAFLAMLLHANFHRAAGYRLPVKWVSVMDTFTTHESKTHDTLKAEWWDGTWTLSHAGHIATASFGAEAWAEVHLLGVEDQAHLDRVRLETVGVHFDEVAEASFIRSRGINAAAWTTALTSQRLRTFAVCDACGLMEPEIKVRLLQADGTDVICERCGNVARQAHVAMMTSNYPDRNHWAWHRFMVEQHPGTLAFRIPAGESASAAQRAEWARALRGQPQLLRRLVEGEPGFMPMGEPCTPAYQSSRHTCKELPFGPGEVFLGHDFWHMPAAVVATLTSMGQLRIHFARMVPESDIGALARDVMKPWLARNGLLERPLVHTGDRTGEGGDQSDKTMSAVKRLLTILPGRWLTVSNKPEQRIAALNTALQDSLSNGQPKILLGPEASELDEACIGGWHFRETGMPEKTGEAGRHSHVGDAAAYLALALFGGDLLKPKDWSRWVNQSSYRQPWGGSTEESPSPASPALQRLEQTGASGHLGPAPGTAAYRARWMKQYERD